MSKRATTLRELAKVRADNREFLNAVVGNQGTALGRKNFDPQGNPDGDPCIIIYMPHKVHEALLSDEIKVPRVLKSKDGGLEAPTDVVVTTASRHPKKKPELSDANQKLVKTLQWKDGKLDKITSGSQVGGGRIKDRKVGGYYGTIGYMVRSRSNSEHVGFITNQHVGLHCGHSMYIPGYGQSTLRVGITREVFEYKPDDQWFPGIDEPYAFVRTDVAFVEVEQKVRNLLRNEIPTVGAIKEPFQIDLDSMDIIGKHVKKVGRTTGLQHGIVVAFGYGITSEEEYLDRFVKAEPANFYTDLLIAPHKESELFSTHGDSGSAILIDSEGEDNNRPVALLWGGWPTDIGRGRGVEDLTYGIDINRILEILNLELLNI